MNRPNLYSCYFLLFFCFPKKTVTTSSLTDRFRTEISRLCLLQRIPHSQIHEVPANKIKRGKTTRFSFITILKKKKKGRRKYYIRDEILKFLPEIQVLRALEKKEIYRVVCMC